MEIHRPSPALPSYDDLFRHSGHHKTIVISRLFAKSDHKKVNFKVFYHKRVIKTTQIAYCSLQMQLCVSRDLFLDLPAGVVTVRTFLPR